MDANESPLLDELRGAVTDEVLRKEVERRIRSTAELLTFSAGAKWAIERLLAAAKSHEGGGSIEIVRADNAEADYWIFDKAKESGVAPELIESKKPAIAKAEGGTS